MLRVAVIPPGREHTKKGAHGGNMVSPVQRAKRSVFRPARLLPCAVPLSPEIGAAGDGEFKAKR